MEHSQTPTQGTIVSDDKPNNAPAMTPSGLQAGGPGTDTGKNAEILLIEGLLSILQKLTEEKRHSRFKRFLNHGMTLLLVGGLLSGGVGSFLTYYYTKKAQALAADRSFSDELNKLRIQKVSEVWERIDQDRVRIEIMVNRISEADAGDKATQNDVLQQIEKLINTDRETVGQYHFWISQEMSDTLNRYLNATFFLVTKQILEPEADVESLAKDRDAARAHVEIERAKFLNSPKTSPCYLF